MKLKEIMTRDVEVARPHDTLQEAARKMRERDIGFLPIYEGDQLVGAISDRDLAIRALAEGMSAKDVIGRDLMTSPVVCCFEDQDVSEAVALMEKNQIRRLVVLSRDDQRLVGVVSLGDLAMNGTKDMSAKVLHSVSEPIIF